MENMKLSKETLKNMPNEALVEIILLLQNNIEQLNRNVELLTEQIKINNQRKFGRSTETASSLFEFQQFDLAFNEAEAIVDETVEEPTVEQLPKKSKQKGTKENNLKKIANHREVIIEMTNDELNEKYGEGKWKKLPMETVVKLEHHPAYFEVVTYKIGVYAKNDNETIVRAERPQELIPGSIVTPSLMSSILFAKYVNAVPLYRQEQAYQSSDVLISRQNMANWTIKVSEQYFKAYYDEMKKEMMHEKILNVDETPFLVTKDGRKAGSKSYMWVYRSSNDKEMVLYDYQLTRKAEHPQHFLSDYDGIIVSDGYAAYHKLAKEHPERFRVAGCWAHLKRIFATSIKSVGKETSKGTVAEAASIKISNLYHMDNKGKDMTTEERTKYRQEIIKPLVDEFFEWAKAILPKVPTNSETGKGLQYAINQEPYLRTFLTNPIIPLDNNAAERSIRPFCLGKKNWVMIDTIQGAHASAIIYSIVETAKANDLKIYDYLKYLLEELPKYVTTTKSETPSKLFPWSTDFPQELRKATDK